MPTRTKISTSTSATSRMTGTTTIVSSVSATHLFLPSLSGGGSFVSKIFLPSPEHSADFVESKNEVAVAFVVNHFVFPTELEEEFEEV